VSQLKTMMIYGASGYTGGLVAYEAKRAGLRPILAGRSGAQLEELAAKLGLEHRVFAADSTRDARRALADIDLLVNCAGPFQRTAPHLIPAAISARTHYLDVSAELDSYRLSETLGAEAKRAGVMLMPGGGGSVAMIGSLVAVLAGKVEKPSRISLALHVAGSMSRGSAISAAENVSPTYITRQNGALLEQPNALNKRFDFGSIQAECFPATLPDVITLWRDHLAPNIETFVHVSGTAFSDSGIELLPAGPDEFERARHRYQAAAVVTGDDGHVVRGSLDTVNGYSFTPLAIVEASRRILNGAVKPGFQTSTSLFGARFAEDIADTSIQVIQCG